MERYGNIETDFEWDSSKESENINKHGVSFTEAVESFFDPLGFTMRDSKHCVTEERFFWIGKSYNGRILTTRFTKRGNKIRIIGSAQWRKFVEIYNETTKNKFLKNRLT